MKRCKSFELKTNACTNPNQQLPMTNDGIVSPASTKVYTIANSCFWQSKTPTWDIMFTGMANIITKLSRHRVNLKHKVIFILILFFFF
jgi:hypothetical protein